MCVCECVHVCVGVRVDAKISVCSAVAIRVFSNMRTAFSLCAYRPHGGEGDS